LTAGEICSLEINWENKENRMEVGQKGSECTDVASRGMNLGGVRGE